MEIKPGYKETELGVIPEDWEIKPLRDICTKIQDGTHFSPVPGGNDYLYVTSKNIRPGILDVTNADRIDAIQHRAIYARCDVRKGDLLLTKDGANTGNAALNHLDEEFSLLSSVALLRFDSRYHTAGYYVQQILSREGQQRIKGLMVGNAITRITLEKLRRLSFPVPPLPEQRAIAAALSDTDALLSSLDRLLAKKRDIKQAVMQQLLTGKQRLSGFSGEWEMKRLGDISKIGMGRTPSRQMQAFWGKGYPWLSIADLKTKHVSDTKEEITRLAASSMTVIPKGTLIMSFKLSIGRMAFTARDMYSNEAICSFNDLKMNAGFLYYVLGQTDFSLYGKQAVKGSTLNSESLKIIEVPYPSLNEQAAIAAVLSDMDTEIDELQQRRDKTRAIKQGMMQELLTGRIRLV